MRKTFNKFTFLLFIFIFFSFIGCSKDGTNIDKKVKVAVSIVPQKTFVEAVGKDFVEVVTMIPPGNSPQNYAPSPRELQMLSKSSIYFTIGVPTEKANILPKLSDMNKHIQLVSLEKEVAKVYKDREFAPGKRDPHIWLSPKRAKLMVEVIKNKLSEIDPLNKKVYEKNAKDYIAKLNQLDQKIKVSIEQLPKRAFVVYHPAFGYFAEDYGLKMIPIEKEGKEATVENIKEIIDFAKKENIKTVFYQAEIDSKQSSVIAEEIGGKTKEILPLAPNYIENLENMAKTFVEALQ